MNGVVSIRVMSITMIMMTVIGELLRLAEKCGIRKLSMRTNIKPTEWHEISERYRNRLETPFFESSNSICLMCLYYDTLLITDR